MSRKQGEQNIRKLSKVGGGATYSITLPIEMIRKFKWKEKQKLIVEMDEGGQRIIIRDWKK